jgi:peptidyl-tRNA hydrolase
MKLHIITRRDLPAGQQAVQAIHVMREFVREHPDTDREWYQKSNTLAFLSVEDEKALTCLLSSAQLRRIAASGFREPDRDDELTAIAIGPRGKGLCRRLRLALSEVDACEAITCTPTIVAKTSAELNTTTDELFSLTL